MTIILLAATGFVLLLNLIYTITSEIRLRRLLREWRQRAPSDNFLMEHLVHTRSSFNLIYAMITTGTIVLTFLGYNQLQNIKESVTKEVLSKTQVDLESASANLELAKAKVNNIIGLDSSAQVLYEEMNGFYSIAKQSQLRYDKLVADHSQSVKSMNLELDKIPRLDMLIGNAVNAKTKNINMQMQGLQKRIEGLTKRVEAFEQKTK